MTDMPRMIFVDTESFEWTEMNMDTTQTAYLRADIHEAKLTKLRNALDVAEKALDKVAGTLGSIAYVRPVAREALTAIKQAKGEA